MNIAVYQYAFFTLLALIIFTLLVALASLVGMILRWRTPKRRVHVVRLLVCLVAVPLLIGAHFALLYGVVLPAMGRQQMAKINADRAERFRESTYLFAGDTAPEFSVTTLEGQEFSLSEARGKVVLINFFATWCGPCHAELPHIQQIWEKHGHNPNFQLIMIAREETEEEVRPYREEKNITFPLATDPSGEVFGMFAESYIPRNVVISPDGQIVFSQMGFDEREMQQLEAVIDEQLADVP